LYAAKAYLGELGIALQKFYAAKNAELIIL
jgi:hypothetical protein